MAAAIGGLVVVGLGVAAQARNEVWRSHEVLWADAVSKAPLHPLAHSNLGVSRLQSGDFDGARIALEEALRLDDGLHSPHQNLGALSVAIGDFGAAAEHYRRALEVEPLDPLSLAGLGAVAMEEGRAAEAIELHRRSLAVRSDPRIHANLGQIYAVRGDLERALSELTRAVAIDSSFALGQRELGGVLLRLGRADEAARALERAGSLDPALASEPQLFADLASAHAAAGRPERAARAAAAGAEVARARGQAALALELDARARLLGVRGVPSP